MSNAQPMMKLQRCVMSSVYFKQGQIFQTCHPFHVCSLQL